MKNCGNRGPAAPWATCALAVFFAASLEGQSTFGAILGDVADQNAAVMPGVEVVLTQQETNVQRRALSNEVGRFEFLNLLPGTYRLEARREGFKTFVQKDIQLSARQAVRVDALMEVGALAETVTVKSTPGLIATETAAVSGTVSGGEIFFLSPNSTSQRPWELMRLDPLVQNTTSATRFSMGGAYVNQSEFQVDGISAPLGSGQAANSMVMSSEALQEVSIQAVNNQAEYASPGVFQQVSKGGGNTFRGDVFYNFASSALNARNPTSLAKAASHDHYFGGNIGGPIRLPGLYDGRNRTFFSLSWQSRRTPGSQTYMANVPTRNMRAAVFSSRTSDPLTGQPFPNGTIPQSRINPTARFFQNTYFPEPSQEGVSNNFQTIGPASTTREEVVDARFDQHINSRHWMFGRVGMTQFNNRTYESNLPTIGFRANTRKLYTSVLSYTYTIRPTLLNELRGGAIRDNAPAGGSNNGLEVLRAAGINFPADLPAPPDARGFPVIQVTGLQFLSQQNTARNVGQIYQLTDTLSWIKGKHTFKGGLNVFWEQPTIARIPSGAHGNFRFQGAYTGEAYADFLLGIPDQTTVTPPSPSFYMRSTNYGLFFQDDFKIRPALTLNLGIRWDYQGPIYNKNDALYNFDPARGALVKAAPGTPVNGAFAQRYPQVRILEAAAAGMPERNLHFADKNNFAPRAGFAWRPRNWSSFVVRGGWGKFTDIIGQGVIELFGTGGFLNQGDLVFTNAKAVQGILPASAFRFPDPFPAVRTRETAPGLTAGGFNPRLANPYVQQWNLTVEKALAEISFRASYIGTKSTNLVYRRDINQRVIAGADSSRPYQSMGFTSGILYMDNGGNQIYHSMQLKATRRLRNGFMFQTGYVWGKNISDIIDGGDRDYAETSTDARCRCIDRGRVGYSRTHNFTAYAVWELPFGKGRAILGGVPVWMNQVVGGWQLYPQFYAGSGQWFSPQRQGSNPFTGLSGETGRSDRIGDGNDGPRQTGASALKWFNTSAFVQPPADRLGNAGRNILLGPGFWSTHLGLTKKFRFLEGKELWLGVTAQNLFNHPNWRSPSTSGELTVGQSAFGSTSSLINSDRGAYATSRWMMLRARIVF
jgi:hypothetical protein